MTSSSLSTLLTLSTSSCLSNLSMPRLVRHLRPVLMFLLVALAATVAKAQTDVAGREASGAGAALSKVASDSIDLRSFPMVGQEPKPNHRVLASQSYATTATVQDAAESILQSLVDSGWTRSADTMISDAYASATLTRDGYVLSLSVTPSGEAGRVAVNLANHGNLDLKSLTLPDGCEEVFASPVMLMVRHKAGADEIRQQIAGMLADARWEPMGNAGGAIYVRKDGVKLSINVQAAPGFGGETSIQIMAEQLSYDLPLPPGASGVQYTDAIASLRFDHAGPMAEVVDFYRAALGQSGWQPTTENPVKIGFRDHLIFRNAAKEMLELEMQAVDGMTRVGVQFTDAEEVADEDRRASELAAAMKAKAEAEKVVPEVSIRLPASAKFTKKGEKQIDFAVKGGRAKDFSQALTKSLEADGWKATVNVAEAVAGDIDFEKDGKRLQLAYTDTGFLAPEVSLSIFGKGKLVVVAPAAGSK
jgi:hypothetical protein